MNSYIFINSNTVKYIAMDQNSGGYPYETDRWQDVKIWPTILAAQEYYSHFKNENWILWEVLGLDKTKIANNLSDCCPICGYKK